MKEKNYASTVFLIIQGGGKEQTMDEIKSKEDNFLSFWEMKAKRYPLPFDEKVLSTTLRVIEIVKEKGIEIAGAKILDIGCGTGIYTLPLAQKAALVVGIDPSKTMLCRLGSEKNRHCLMNVEIVKSKWEDLDILGKNFKRPLISYRPRCQWP